jgi:RNA polymerase sigma-70 factor (ECF subfamily)
MPQPWGVTFPQAMEETWIAGCIQGKRDAQEQLYRHYSPKVMGVCRRYADTAEDAKDIFQEAFINIFNSLKGQRQIDSLDAWVRKVTANTAISYYYKQRKHQNHISTETMLHYDDTNYDNLLGELDREDLLKLIALLPSGCKHVFNLYVVEGYNHKEIAEMMNITEGTSKSQLFRAKDMMKTKLKVLGHVEYKRRVV